MEALSAETTRGLALAGNSKYFSVEETGRLVRFAVSTLAGASKETEPDYGQFSNASPERVKAALAAVLTLLTEALRVDAEPVAISSACEDAGWDGDRSAALTQLVESQQDALRATVQHTGVGLDRIVDLDWRLDYHIRSSASGMAHQPVFIVSAKLEDASGRVRTRQFTCNTVQMEELLARVQDAAKQVDRAVQQIEGAGGPGGSGR